MNREKDKNFIFVTPFLDEVKRIIKNTNINMKQPKIYGESKIDNFNRLIREKENICVTHRTFQNANSETLKALKESNYILIIDEEIEVISNYNNRFEDKISQNDIRLLTESNFIETDKYGKVKWIKESYPKSKYYNIERLIKGGTIYYLDKSMLAWVFPIEIFNSFENIYVLTYMCNGGYLKKYFEYYDAKIEIKSLAKDENGVFTLTEYKKDIENRKRARELIHIIESPKLKSYDKTQLSKNWFLTSSNNKEIVLLKKSIYNFVRTYEKAKSKEIMWTTIKDAKPKLKGNGYTLVRRLTKEEKLLTDDELKEIKNKCECFVPVNSRATNIYSDRRVLIYAFNFYPNPFIKRFFSKKNETDNLNIAIEDDYIAISFLIQWIWRSRIRNNQDIDIYIPSDRMRELLERWLDGAF